MSEQRWSRRRLLYGDWTWFIRDPLDVLRVVFIAGTIVFALMGRSTAIGLTAASVLLLVARVINLPRWFDFSVIAAMILIAYGTAFTLYGDYYVYDNIVHSLSPFFYAPVLYIALVRLGVLTDPAETKTPYHHAGVFVTTLALGMAVGAGYEVIEWLSDSLLGSHFVKSINDTGSDLLEDTLGSLAGATLVTFWSIWHWSSRRSTVVPAPSTGHRPLRATLQRLPIDRLRFGSTWRSRLVGLPTAVKGVVGVAAGTMLLAWPSPALRTVGIVFGVALLVDAALDIAELVRCGARGGLTGYLAEIAAEIAVGVLILAWPGISKLALLYAIGVSNVALAFLEAASLSSPEHSERDRWLGGVVSAASLIFGVALLGSPRRSSDTIIAVFGLYLLVVGALQLVRAFGARRGRPSE